MECREMLSGFVMKKIQSPHKLHGERKNVGLFQIVCLAGACSISAQEDQANPNLFGKVKTTRDRGKRSIQEVGMRVEVKGWFSACWNPSSPCHLKDIGRL